MNCYLETKVLSVQSVLTLADHEWLVEVYGKCQYPAAHWAEGQEPGKQGENLVISPTQWRVSLLHLTSHCFQDYSHRYISQFWQMAVLPVSWPLSCNLIMRSLLNFNTILFVLGLTPGHVFPLRLLVCTNPWTSSGRLDSKNWYWVSDCMSGVVNLSCDTDH